MQGIGFKISSLVNRRPSVPPKILVDTVKLRYFSEKIEELLLRKDKDILKQHCPPREKIAVLTRVCEEFTNSFQEKFGREPRAPEKTEFMRMLCCNMGVIRNSFWKTTLENPKQKFSAMFSDAEKLISDHVKRYHVSSASRYRSNPESSAGGGSVVYTMHRPAQEQKIHIPSLSMLSEQINEPVDSKIWQLSTEFLTASSTASPLADLQTSPLPNYMKELIAQLGELARQHDDGTGKIYEEIIAKLGKQLPKGEKTHEYKLHRYRREESTFEAIIIWICKPYL